MERRLEIPDSSGWLFRRSKRRLQGRESDRRHRMVTKATLFRLCRAPPPSRRLRADPPPPQAVEGLGEGAPAKAPPATPPAAPCPPGAGFRSAASRRWSGGGSPAPPHA